jgi:hypothetical protein
LGSELGGRASTAGANAGQFLSRAGTTAAITRQAGDYGSGLGGALSGFAESPYAKQFGSEIGNKVGEWWNSMGTSPTAADYNISPEQFGAYYGQY